MPHTIIASVCVFCLAVVIVGDSGYNRDGCQRGDWPGVVASVAMIAKQIS